MKAILTYHSIDSSDSVISITEQTFARHLAWLRTHVPVVPLDELRSIPNEHAVAITFDDGFQNFADVALPVLRTYGMPVTVFAATDYVGRTNEWSVRAGPAVPHLPLMGWAALERIADLGVSIGSHTRTHPRLNRVDASQLQDEIAGSAQIITDRLGKTPRAFAYPYGDYDVTALEAARCTYATAVTTELRAVEPSDDALQLPRLDAYYFKRAGVLEAFGTAGFRRFLWVRRHGRAVRRAFSMAGARA